MRRYFSLLILVAAVSSLAVLQVKTATGQGLGDPRVAAAYAMVGAALSLMTLTVLQTKRIGEMCGRAFRLNPWAALFGGTFVIVGAVQWLGGGTLSDFATGLAYGFNVIAGFYIVPAVLYSSNNVFFYFRTVAILGGLVALVGIYSALTGASDFLGLAAGTKPGSLFGTGLSVTGSLLGKGNLYAFSMALGVWLALGIMPGSDLPSHRKRYWQPLVRWLVLVLFLAAVGVSWSRSMYAGVAGAAMIYWLSSPRTRVRSSTGIWGAVAVGVFLLGTAGWYLSDQFWFTAVVQLVLQPEAGITGRAELWPAAVEIIGDNAAFGLGLGGSASKQAIYQSGGYQWEAVAMGAHNAFLDLGVRGGILLPLFYVAAIAVTWKHLLSVSLRTAPYYLARTGGVLRATLFVISVAVMFTSTNLGGLNFASLNLSILLGLSSAFPLIRRGGTGQGSPQSAFTE